MATLKNYERCRRPLLAPDGDATSLRSLCADHKINALLPSQIGSI
jgi:hypothetical protein